MVEKPLQCCSLPRRIHAVDQLPQVLAKRGVFGQPAQCRAFAQAALVDENDAVEDCRAHSVGSGGGIEGRGGATLFFASPASDFVTGQILYLDGGITASQ